MKALLQLGLVKTTMSSVDMLLCLMMFYCWTPSVPAAPGTPDNIESIFIGRCHEYQDVINPKPFANQKKNCTQLWQLFSGAFSYKQPCGVSISDYEEFVVTAHHNMDTMDSVMFWEHVYPFVYEYTSFGRRYLAIADYLPGYIVQTLQWCGQVGGSGLNYIECPEWESCPQSAMASFWKSVSADFSRQVEGNVHVMLNGSIDVAFLTSSIFAEYELANLNRTRNGKLDAFVLHDIGKPFKETCHNGSLLTLKKIVEQKGIVYQCTDDPLDLTHLQCVDNVNDVRCRLASSVSSASWTPFLYLLGIVTCILTRRIDSSFINLI